MATKEWFNAEEDIYTPKEDKKDMDESKILSPEHIDRIKRLSSRYNDLERRGELSAYISPTLRHLEKKKKDFSDYIDNEFRIPRPEYIEKLRQATSSYKDLDRRRKALSIPDYIDNDFREPTPSYKQNSSSSSIVFPIVFAMVAIIPIIIIAFMVFNMMMEATSSSSINASSSIIETISSTSIFSNVWFFIPLTFILMFIMTSVMRRHRNDEF